MTEIIEQRIIQDFSCYYDLYIPEGNSHKPLLIAMHGYGGDKSSMMRLTQKINDKDFAIAALQGPHQHLNIPKTREEKLKYGFGWLSNFKPEESVELHHKNVRHIIATLTDAGTVDPTNVFLIGFSQSVALNFRFAFTHANLLRGVIGLYGGIPGDWQAPEKYAGKNLDVLYIGGKQDEYYGPEILERNAEALRSQANSVTLEIFDNGHEVARAAFPVINEWLGKMRR